MTEKRHEFIRQDGDKLIWHFHGYSADEVRWLCNNAIEAALEEYNRPIIEGDQEPDQEA